jgi:hypothetical protein
MILKVLKRVAFVFALGITGLVMANCTMLGMNYASLETSNKAAPTPALNVTELAESAAERAALQASFEAYLYGPMPQNLPLNIGDWRSVDAPYLNGLGTVQEVPITIGSGDGARTVNVVVAMPSAPIAGGFPLIVSQTFSSNCSVFPSLKVTAPTPGEMCDGSEMDGMMGSIATSIFGTFIAEAPVERYLEAGIAYASFYGGEVAPDSAKHAPGSLAALGGGESDAPTSTLAAWAYGFSAAIDAIEADPRIRQNATLSMGHSRYGKAALMAAAWYANVDGAISHQSGFGGAALSRSTTGEGLSRMAKSYPHWLSPNVRDYLDDLNRLPVEQHQLLALIAPKPVFLGNGRRDVWSDPNSTWRAAEAASEVYEQLGARGLQVGGMRDFDASAGIAYWMRAGGHSVVSEDIDALIAFTQAHFISAPTAGERLSTTSDSD